MTVSFQSKKIEEFTVQTESTKESKNYVDNLSGEEKDHWLQNLPDSIPLELTCVLKLSNDFKGSVHVKVGSIDGANDLFSGAYDLNSTSSVSSISYHKSEGLHYFNLGKVKHQSSLTIIIWLNNNEGTTVDVIKYQK